MGIEVCVVERSSGGHTLERSFLFERDKRDGQDQNPKEWAAYTVSNKQKELVKALRKARAAELQKADGAQAATKGPGGRAGTGVGAGGGTAN